MTRTRRAVVGAGALLWMLAVWGPDNHWASDGPRAVGVAAGLLAAGDSEGALAEVEPWLAGQPGLGVRVVAGFAAWGAGQPTRAAEQLAAARRIAPGDPRALLGACLLGDDEACAQAVAGQPDACTPRLARGVRPGPKAPGAEEDRFLCAALDPAHPLAPATSAAAGPDPAAAGAWLGAVARDAARRRALDEAARRIEEGRGPSALAALEPVARQGLEAQLLAALAHHAEGRSDRARSELAALAGPLAGVPRLAADACVLAGDLEAHRDAEALCPVGLLAADPDRACAASHGLAVSRIARGEWEAAERAFAPCLPRRPEDGPLWADAALVAAARGEVAEAVTRLAEADRIDPGALDPTPWRQPALARFVADPRGAAALAAMDDGAPIAQ